MDRYEKKFIPRNFKLFDTEIVYRIAPNFTCEIVDVESQIKSQGNGTKALLEFEKFIKETYQIKNLYAFSRYTNTMAHKWYIKNNFTATLVPNFYFDEPKNYAVLMTKNI